MNENCISCSSHINNNQSWILNPPISFIKFLKDCQWFFVVHTINSYVCLSFLISMENFCPEEKTHGKRIWQAQNLGFGCWHVMNKKVILKNDCTKYGYTFLIALWETWDMWGIIPDIELDGFCLHSGHPANEKIEKLFQNPV